MPIKNPHKCISDVLKYSFFPIDLPEGHLVLMYYCWLVLRVCVREREQNRFWMDETIICLKQAIWNSFHSGEKKTKTKLKQEDSGRRMLSTAASCTTRWVKTWTGTFVTDWVAKLNAAAETLPGCSLGMFHLNSLLKRCSKPWHGLGTSHSLVHAKSISDKWQVVPSSCVEASAQPLHWRGNRQKPVRLREELPVWLRWVKETRRGTARHGGAGQKTEQKPEPLAAAELHTAIKPRILYRQDLEPSHLWAKSLSVCSSGFTWTHLELPYAGLKPEQNVIHIKWKEKKTTGSIKRLGVTQLKIIFFFFLL